jgi:hypothetical protein
LQSLHHSSQISGRAFDLSSLVDLVEKLLSSIPKLFGGDSGHQGDANKGVVYQAPSVVAYNPPVSVGTQVIDNKQNNYFVILY